jgi:hypothetical protein
MANTPVDPPPPGQQLIFPAVTSALVIGNDTPTALNIRVRPLKDTIVLECAAVSEDPQAMLSSEAFGPAVVWQVEPGRAFAPREEFGVPAECDAYLIDGADVPAMLLFWNSADFVVQQLPSTVAGGDPARLITISGDPTREVLRWSDHDAVFSAPSSIDPHAKACGIPAASAGVTWETPIPAGKTRIHSVVTAPDGCTKLSVGQNADPDRDWFVCGAAGVQLPFAAGDDVLITPLFFGQDIGPVTGVEFLTDRYTVRLARGTDTVSFGAGGVDVDPDPECGGSHSACGDYLQPMRVSIQESGEHTYRLRAGEDVDLAQGGTLYLVRSEYLPVADTACDGADDATDTGLSIHSVFVELHDSDTPPSDVNP